MTGFSETVAGLIDAAKRDQYLWVPLQFWFNRFYEQALPLIALQYHEVCINIKTRALSDLGIETGGEIGNSSFSNAGTGAAPTLDDAVLLVSYVFLDTMERRMFAQQAHEYLIDQVQYTGAESHTSATSSQNFRMNFNHPVQELIWVCQRDDVILSGTSFQGNDHFNWSGVQATVNDDIVPNSTTTFETDPFLNAEIQLNGHQRTLNHRAQYYRNVQPYQHHSRLLDKHVYLYSFALYPEDVKPSGSVNLSRIDNAVLRMSFPTGTNNYSTNSLAWTGQVRIYARSKNVIKIVSGMIGLMYAN